MKLSPVDGHLPLDPIIANIVPCFAIPLTFCRIFRPPSSVQMSLNTRSTPSPVYLDVDAISVT